MTKLQGIIGDAASDFMNTQSEVLELKHTGFPEFENVQSETRTPFIIDPAEHIVEWLSAAVEALPSSYAVAIRFGKKLTSKAGRPPPALFISVPRARVRDQQRLTPTSSSRSTPTSLSSSSLTPREASLVAALRMQLLMLEFEQLMIELGKLESSVRPPTRTRSSRTGS
jgi:hypothetical protein